MSKKILVTSAGGDIGMNIINILLKQKVFNCEIFAVDIKDIIFSQSQVDFFSKVPRTSDDSYTDIINKIIFDNNIDLIIPASEYDINFFNSNRELYKEKVNILINNTTIIKNFLDKKITSEFLTDINIPVPKTWSLKDYNIFEGYDIIVKAARSTVTKKILKIESQEQLDQLREGIDDLSQYIVQEYIGSIDQELTTAVYRDDNIFAVISFKRRLIGGMTGYAEIYKSDRLESYAKKIAEETNLKGSINIQSRKYDNDYFIFEINPRISSTVYIRDHFDFNDLIWWCCSLLNINYKKCRAVKDSGIAVLGYVYNFYDKEA
ncbi:ATP-grasp domain-containing protein [Francisella sp. XLW-1]|uniref:ATP-grasp domain-containing protein n=1 Tax=Francisella sp. XLW-1 TaxID=2610887 RepID=UPI00123D9CE7|nr:ATP-grasp domain-containing protein [Francisella sp. XLW-1]